MTLEQYRTYRSLKLLNPHCITDCYTRPDGIVTIIQHDGYGNLVKTVDVNKNAFCIVTEFTKDGPVLQNICLPRERTLPKNQLKAKKSDKKCQN